MLLADNVDRNTLERARVMSDQVDALDRQIEAEERGGNEFYTRVPPRGQPSASEDEGGFTARDSRSSRAVNSPATRAFEKFIRSGKGYESRDLLVGDTGEALVPQEFYPVLTEARKAWGGIVNIVNTRETDSGAPLKIGFSNDTANLAHIVGETGPVEDVDPSLNSTLSSTDQLVTDLIKVSISEMQDAYFDLDAFIRDQFGKRYYRGLASLITNGSFAGSPPEAQNIQSIVTGATQGATSASANAIAYSDVVTLYGALDPAYIDNATWTMNSKTRTALLGITDSLGRPLFIPNPSSGAFDQLLGRPVVINQYLDDIGASNVALQFGDYKQGYLLRSVKPGLAIARLNERFMDTLEIGFLGYFRSGGLVTDAGDSSDPESGSTLLV